VSKHKMRRDQRLWSKGSVIPSLAMARSISSILVIGFCTLGLFSPVAAQSDLGTGLDVFPKLSLGSLGDPAGAPATITASYSRDSETSATLSVKAAMLPDWHIYSITQAKGGPIPTTVKVTSPAEVKLTGNWTASQKPKISTNDIWPGLQIEEHYDTVTWTAPLSVPSGFSGEIQIVVGGLICKTDGSCVPMNEKLAVKLTSSPAGETKPAMQVVDTSGAKPGVINSSAVEVSEAEIEKTDGVTVFRNPKSVVQWTGVVTPAKASHGTTATLRITAKPDPTFHVYAAAVDDTESRTNFVVTDKAGLRLGMPQPPQPPIVKTILPSLPPVEYHEGEITWTIPIEIGQEVTAGTKTIVGLIGYQACTDTSCLQPKSLRFTARLDVSATAADGVEGRPIRFVTAAYGATMDAAAETDWVDQPEAAAAPGPDASETAAGRSASENPPAQASAPLSLLFILAMAIGGGLILNLMPCVLPVVGLKIMSFASQAGENRGKVLALNLAYTLGILVVFWALSALAIISTYSWGREFLGIEGQMSWGQQFQYFAFRYGVILLVFALALSFLGVWEIPLPGFVGGRSTQQLQQKEGFSGAFFKGIFTTLLATPCSGPLLGTVFAYTLGKSAIVIWAIFTAIGLGMALPYLLIALFPPLIAFLPKPGAWMDTLKQLLGFLLLATCVFIFSFFPDSDRVMVFASLMAVWFGCWVIGSVPAWETLPKRLAAWGGGIGMAAAICYFAMWATAPGPVVIAWEPYDEVRLEKLRSEGRTVLIDFTAKWCVNCQVNYKVAINTEETGRLVNELAAIPMLADWTDHSEQIRSKLQELNSNSIPVLAIYPGSDPQNPIVLRDLVSQGDVLSALRTAGPSVSPRRSDVAVLGPIDVSR